MRKFLIIYLFISVRVLLSQPQIKHYDNWIFGENAGITFNTPDGNPISLNIGEYNFEEGTSSFSDDEGNLLYYIEFGESSASISSPTGVINNGGDIFTNVSTSNTALFIQHLTDDNLVYVITADVAGFENEGINYCIIDKSQNEVIVKNKNLYKNATEKIAAVYNETDNIVWVITHEMGTDAFKIIKIDENGLDENIITQNIGFEHLSIESRVGTGRLNLSPNGKLLSVTVPYYNPNLNSSEVSLGKVQLLSFDPKSGILSNPLDLGINEEITSTCFSLNSEFLYVKGDSRIYQYNISNFDVLSIIKSRYIIYTSPNSSNFNNIERGPNGIIYTGREGNYYLDAILKPNEKGIDCNYTEDVVELSNDMSARFRRGFPTILNSFYIDEIYEPILCIPEISTYLTDKTIELGKEFCINGNIKVECEEDTYLDSLFVYFEYDPRLMSLISSSIDYELIFEEEKNIIEIQFYQVDKILNQNNDFTLCFKSLLGHSKLSHLDVIKDESYNVKDFINSSIEYISCEQPYRQIRLIVKTDFDIILDNNNIKINLSTQEKGEFKYSIIDINGKELNNISFNSIKDEYRQEEILIINLEDLPAGNYFIRMITPSGELITKQFIKV